MKTLHSALKSVIVLLLLICTQSTSSAQSVLDPNDPIVVYNPAAPPATPAWGQPRKWVKTNRLSWNTSAWKAYYYNGFAFRLKFPKTYNPTANDGKKYPMIIFFHGRGEGGTVYDNEFSLYHGGQQFQSKVDNGTFDGYVLVMQTTNGFWGQPPYDALKGIMDYMITNNKLDGFKVITNGLSSGGSGTWEMTLAYPTYISAMMPMSASSTLYRESSVVQPLKFTPIWIFQGGTDPSPTPYTTEGVRDAFLNAGGSFKYSLYPTLGHGTWNAAWAESDFYPFLNRSYKSNPWPLFGRTEFCPGEAINITIGLTAGFTQYEWRKDGVLLPTATGNTLNITGTATAGNAALGVYSARVRRGTIWSEWSPVPVEVKIKAATPPPPITVQGMQSKVIPALDGSTGVTLSVPTGYTSYLWQKEGSGTSLGTTNTLLATTPGDYKVRVTEQFGCSSEFSPLFTVIDANGPNKPDPVSGVLVTTLSKTALRLDWSQTPNPLHNETNFEIYQSEQAGGAYKLVAITGADQTTFTVNNLKAKTKYHYRIRAVNETGASAGSAEVSGTTDSDSQAPTAPGNLTIIGTTRSSITVSWTESTDDVEVVRYDVYVNGVLSYLTTETQFEVANLVYGQTYNIVVKARDASNNVSVASNQVTGQALLNGLAYKYYTYTGNWTSLPNFANLTPTSTGTMPAVSISNRTQNDYIAYLWEGYIKIPVSGTYYLRTRSDDGSRLWLGALNGTTSPYVFGANSSLVNNDGLHGAQDRTSIALNLTAGIYPIAIAFYEQTGSGESMSVSWRTPQTGTNYVAIPASAFGDAPVATDPAPVAPSALVATAVSFKRIDLSWIDNSNNETGFEVSRSTNATTGFATIATIPANSTSYVDSSLNATTTYYYRVRSIGMFGESEVIQTVDQIEANWKFDNNLNDASGNGRTLSQSSNPTYSNSDLQEGTHSIGFNGTNQSVTPPANSSFLQNVYAEKTVAFWMKSNNNTGNRVIVDIGGNDDGLALRLDANRLYAGVASNNTRRSFFVSYTSTGWNHIALVYRGNTLRLYVNGVEAGADTDLGFSATTTTTNGSRIGGNNSSNAFNTATGFFNGRIDNFAIYTTALSPENINRLMNNQALTQSYATTLALPTAPAVPQDLVASAVSTVKTTVSWTDVANETAYQVFRSSNNNSNYILFATVPANTTSFADSGLFSNAIYYYQVRAVNDGGTSDFSNEDSAKTFNNQPVVAAIANQFMRYATTLQVPVSATDADPETLTITTQNLPAFASFTPGANGAGTISFTNPDLAAQGVYTGIIVTVTDQNGGSSSVSFDLVVNTNDAPVITAGGNVAVSELQSTQVNISATDANASDVLTWTFTGLPSFATPVINGGSVQINVNPGLADHGVYNVGVTVNDGNNGVAESAFTITVNDIDPNSKIYVNFTDGTYTSGAPWNNTNKNPAQNDNFPALKDHTGATTAIGMRVTSYWQGVPAGTNTGVNTGNNSGIYPDNVIRSFWFTNTATQTLQIYGLNPAGKYNFTFFGSRGQVTDDRTSRYAIGGVTVTLNAANNSQNTISANNLTPNADGTLTLTLSTPPTSQFSYLNAMVIESIYDDGTAPAKPRSLAGTFNNGNVNLTWVDAAYNESAYEVYRSTTNEAGSFTLLNPGGNNAGLQQYSNSGVLGNTTYYYYVLAKNGYGNSPTSDTISVTTPNASPVITAIPNVSIKTDDVVNVNVVAADEANDVITLQVSGLPSFATFTPNGNGTGVINVAPGSTTGTFTGITVTATDNAGASSSTEFSITVTDKNITAYYVNFNAVLPVGAPWNSFNKAPYPAGASLNNLVDEAGVTSAISVTMVDAWTDANNLGATTGNNSGVYPDNVMQTFFYTDQATARRVRIAGLPTSANLKYNITFFASRGGVADNRRTTYSYGGQSVTLNAASNTTNTVQLIGVVPNASGVIEFTAQKDAGSAFGYINAMVIESYVDNGLPLAPINLSAAGLNTTIQLNWVDRSNNEDGFEIYKSTSLNGTYSLLTTTAANATTYEDGAVQPGIVYYYKVRAKRLPSVFSSYTNVAAASTILYTVDLNFNDGVSNPAQGGNWNNTNAILEFGYTVPNLKNRLGQNTGINFVQQDGYTGYNIYGKTTGNNSGIYPDNVMAGFFYVNLGDTARWKFTGLNLNGSYNFIFFGSRLSPTGGAVTTSYRIGSQIVTLDATDNTSRTAKISGVKPDSTGTVYITMFTTEGRGYINAMTIEGALSATNLDEGGISGEQMGLDIVTLGQQLGTQNLDVRRTSNASNIPVSILKVGAYPNPFADEITLRFELPKQRDRVTIHLTDLSGKVIFTRELRNLPQGISQFPLGISGNGFPSGVYLLRVQGSEKNVIKVIKN